MKNCPVSAKKKLRNGLSVEFFCDIVHMWGLLGTVLVVESDSSRKEGPAIPLQPGGHPRMELAFLISSSSLLLLQTTTDYHECPLHSKEPELPQQMESALTSLMSQNVICFFTVLPHWAALALGWSWDQSWVLQHYCEGKNKITHNTYFECKVVINGVQMSISTFW